MHRLVLQLKGELFEAILRQDMPFFDKSSPYELRDLVDSCGSVCHGLLDAPVLVA